MEKVILKKYITSVDNLKATFFFKSKQPDNPFLFLYIRSLFADTLPEQYVKQLRELKEEEKTQGSFWIQKEQGHRVSAIRMKDTDRGWESLPDTRFPVHHRN